MSDFLTGIEVYKPVPIFAQATQGGMWSEAIQIELEQASTFLPPEWLITDSVAAEVFYRLNDGRNAYFGLRYDQNLVGFNSHDEFFRKYLKALEEVPKISFRETVELMGEFLN